ncbi:type 1 glutamine amidotransferase [uncultured Enterovirga sp.]|uniref:type 1 glutamine amidotransferase n=1 Tax=uncultured Enterovirga sp. TaxID=2026352 RepID=UPI0035CA739F
MRFLILESEPAPARDERRESVGRSSGETYRDMVASLGPGFQIDLMKPVDGKAELPGRGTLEGYDGIFLTGSPLHLYEDNATTRRQVELMRSVFASGTPSFGSCAGLQVATVAAGGSVRPSARGREAAFARRITRTEAGRAHPLLRERPDVFDAPAIHTDEVEALPEGATLLAGNRVTAIQAAEIRFDGGTFWGVQYHPELSLGEVAGAIRRQADDLIEEGFAQRPEDLEAHADLIERLHHAPDRRDIAWRLGLDEQVTEVGHRTRELRNFIELLVKPTRSERGRA